MRFVTVAATAPCPVFGARVYVRGLKRHPSGVAFSHGTGIEPKLLRWVDIGRRRRPDAGNLNPHGIVP